jgi:hypothetical protein
MDRPRLRPLDAKGATVKHLRYLSLLLLCLLTLPAHAHVGNKDVYETISAGPYKLFVTIRMPNVIPGVATVEVRSTGAPITGLRITPLPVTGEAAKHPPTSDPMKPSADDAAFFTGGVWMMASGSWQVRFDITGAAGERTASVPVPAVAIATLKMQRGLGTVLGILGLFLVLSMGGIVAAAVREARLEPGQPTSDSRRTRSLLAMAGSLAFMALLVYGGAHWWNVEAVSYAEGIYHPLATHATLTGNLLDLQLQPFAVEGRASRSNNDLLPDHGHLMHLYAIRQPEMDAVFHLHPARTDPGSFQLSLPAMPPGRYTLYGDIVHSNGFPETIVTTLDIPADMPASSPGPDDAFGHPAPLSADPLGTSYKLPDGYTMVWDRPATITADTAYAFRFRLMAPDGSPATDMQPYMGMAGHAAFVKTDGTVFAHTHPEGSAAMASMLLANSSVNDTPDGMMSNPADQAANGPTNSAVAGSMNDMPGMSMGATEHISNIVDFPYGFPTPGRYRIFIQMKHGTTIETATFDANVQ